MVLVCGLFFFCLFVLMAPNDHTRMSVCLCWCGCAWLCVCVCVCWWVGGWVCVLVCLCVLLVYVWEGGREREEERGIVEAILFIKGCGSPNLSLPPPPPPKKSTGKLRSLRTPLLAGQYSVESG